MMKPASFLLAVASLALCAAPALAEKKVAMRLPTPVAKAPVKASVPVTAKKIAAPAVAPDALATIEEKPVELGNTGTGFDVFTHKHDVAQAKDAEPTLKLAKSINGAQMVTGQRLADIEYCWDRLPQARRVETTAIIKLATLPIGSVASSTITGDGLHAEFKKCVADVASRWRFPVTDAATEVELAVGLQSTPIAH